MCTRGRVLLREVGWRESECYGFRECVESNTVTCMHVCGSAFPITISSTFGGESRTPHHRCSLACRKVAPLNHTHRSQITARHISSLITISNISPVMRSCGTKRQTIRRPQGFHRQRQRGVEVRFLLAIPKGRRRPGVSREVGTCGSHCLLATLSFGGFFVHASSIICCQRARNVRSNAAAEC